MKSKRRWKLSLSGARIESMELQLLDAERDLLSRILDREFNNLRTEVHHTKTPEFRDQLRTEEALLKGLIDKLQPAES